MQPSLRHGMASKNAATHELYPLAEPHSKASQLSTAMTEGGKGQRAAARKFFHFFKV
jgi:hypothetical protein